jgi:hypothetical protein
MNQAVREDHCKTLMPVHIIYQLPTHHAVREDHCKTLMPVHIIYQLPTHHAVREDHCKTLMPVHIICQLPTHHAFITYLPIWLTGLTSDYLSSCSRVLLEKLTVPKLVKKYPTIKEIQRLITVFTRAHHLSLHQARWVQSTQFHPSSLTLSIPS